MHLICMSSKHQWHVADGYFPPVLQPHTTSLNMGSIRVWSRPLSSVVLAIVLLLLYNATLQPKNGRCVVIIYDSIY